MKLAQLDAHPNYSTGLGPLGTCLQWLDTLLKSPAVPWEPGQRDAAAQALADARTLMLAHAPDVVATVPQLTDGHEAPALSMERFGRAIAGALERAQAAGCGCACEPSGSDGLTCPDPRTGVPLCQPEANAARLAGMDRAGEDHSAVADLVGRCECPRCKPTP